MNYTQSSSRKRPVSALHDPVSSPNPNSPTATPATPPRNRSADMSYDLVSYPTDFESRLLIEREREVAEPSDPKGKGKVKTSDTTTSPPLPNIEQKRPFKKRRVSFDSEVVETSWVRPTSDFEPAPEFPRPKGAASPEIQFFRTTSDRKRWIGKCGDTALVHQQLLSQLRTSPEFISPYQDEILEKLGISIYSKLGVKVPPSTLSYQQVTREGYSRVNLDEFDEADFRCSRLLYLSEFLENFQPLGKGFIDDYLAQSKERKSEYVAIQTSTHGCLPLRGLGSMLAAADLLYDLDCIGNYCGNAGYIIQDDEQGKPYAQLVKIDAGYAFSYYEIRGHDKHDPRKRNIRIAPSRNPILTFEDLAPADKEEFIQTAKRILEIPQEEFASLFVHAQQLEEGIPEHHTRALLHGLIARKNLFLAGFASETNRSLIDEIEAAQAEIASAIESGKISLSNLDAYFQEQRKEAIALEKLRIRLAIVDKLHSERVSDERCQTFQVPKQGCHFVGREEMLKAVAQQLSQSNQSIIGQTITGLGGVGKTQLALQYALAAIEGKAVGDQPLSYDFVCWLNAETFLDGQFQALAEVFLKQELNATDAACAVYQFLRGKRSLLIFDNAENARSIEAFLPPTHFDSRLHLLITSRCPSWGDIPTVKLTGFSEREAFEFVKSQLGEQPAQFVNEMTELLGGLPLAINQAVGYIKAGHCTVEQFAEHFRKNQALLLEHDLLLDDPHPKTIGTTLTLSLAQATLQCPIVGQILNLAAYLSSENISIHFFERPLNASQAEIKKGIVILQNYSLITYNPEADCMQIHRLVQQVVRHHHQKQLKEEDPTVFWKKVFLELDRAICHDLNQIERMKACGWAIEHSLNLATISERIKLSKEQELLLATLLEKSGLHQSALGNYKINRTFQEKVLAVRETHYGHDHVQVAITLTNLGNAYGALGDALKQKELLERSLPILETHYGHDHVHVAITLVNLGTAYGTLGDALKKKELLERSLHILETHYGHDHVHVARTLTNLGNAYGELGDALKQKELLERSLRILETHYGHDHVQVATTLTNLGDAYGELGDALKQKELLERSLHIKETHYGHDHVQVAITLMNLGIAYGELGDVLKQKELLERSLRIQENHYGHDHVNVAITLTNLGIAYGELGDALKQKELLERSLRIDEIHYGPDHVHVAITLTNLGNAYGNLGDALKQKELLERALRILETQCGHDHLQVAITLTSLGIAYGELGDVLKKKDLLERALLIKETHYGHDHLQVARTLTSLGIAYGELGDVLKQKELLERSLRIQENHYGHDHVNVAITLGNLAYACLALGEVSGAKNYAQKTYTIFREYYGESHSNTQQSKSFLKKCEEASRRKSTSE